MRDMDRLDELIVCLEAGVDFHTHEGELLDLFKELKQLRLAFDYSCGWLDELGECAGNSRTCKRCDCKNCIREHLLDSANEEIKKEDIENGMS